MHELSLHPAHLVGSSSLPPATALIPYCAYMGDMTTLGTNIPGFTYPVCTAFQPTILEGQLCYKLNMTNIDLNRETHVRSKFGKGKGLLLLIDKSKPIYEANFMTPTAENPEEKNLLRTETEFDVEGSTRIFIDTLESFTDYRTGVYALSAMKMMSGTRGFLALPEETRLCQTQELQECQNQKYLEEVQSQCGCIPWSLKTSLPQPYMQKVITHIYFIISFLKSSTFRM